MDINALYGTKYNVYTELPFLNACANNGAKHQQNIQTKLSVTFHATHTHQN